MEIVILSLAILVSAIIAIFYKQKEDIKMYAVFKPLTTILIIVVSIIINFHKPNTYNFTILIALLFCLAGDIFLIYKRLFMFGLFSFLLAHVVLIVSFSSLFGFCWNVVPLLLFSAIAICFYWYLKSNLKHYKIPVAVYIAVIVVMSWQAVGLLFQNYSMVYVLIAIASILFFVSDSILALKRFKKPNKYAEVFILSTYWSAIFIFTTMGLFV
jgi:uncharacterized membrane protein YhhN